MSSPPQKGELVTLKVDSDRMALHASWQSADIEAEAFVEAVYAEAEKLKLELPEDKADIRAKIDAALAAETAAGEVLLLSGTPMVPPVDERTEWERDFFTQGFKVDPRTGRIDYRERTLKRTVGEGEALARITVSEPGEPGTDIFGKSCPAPAPKKVYLRAGRDVDFNSDTREFSAARVGRLRVSDNMLAVDETYEINGSVGLETGNITFPGYLVVRGEIESLAVVDVEGGIEVSTMIGAADVKSGGDIVVGGGISGAGKARISVGAVVQAAYIANAEVRAGADVVILKEIVQSDVRSRGEVRAETGRIVGGRVEALAGMVVAEAGSAAGVSTELCVGEDYALPEFLAKHERATNLLREKSEEIQTKFRVLKSRSMTVKQKQMAEKLALQLRAIDARIKEIEEWVAQRHAQVKEASCRQVRVLKKLHSRVTFKIAGQTMTTDTSRSGPLLVRLDDFRRILVQ